MAIDTAKLGAYVADGAPSESTLIAAKLGAYVADGPPAGALLVAKLGMYVVDGPPSERPRRRQMAN